MAQNPVFAPSDKFFMLDIVDAQKDFMLPGYALAVPGADALVAPMNDFLRRVPRSLGNGFAGALVKYDTHFEEEYPKSNEAKLFPNPHCLFGHDGWQYAIDLAPIAGRSSYLLKNQFDMWSADPLKASGETVDFALPARAAAKTAYDSLFSVKDSTLAASGEPLNDFLFRKVRNAKIAGKTLTVVMIGVASDYCVLDALRGYVRQGFPVLVLTDLVKGIGGNPERCVSGAIEDAVAQNFTAQERKQITLMESADFLSAFPRPDLRAQAAERLNP